MLTDLALEARVGLDDKSHTGAAQAFGQALPVRLGEYDAEVRHGNVVAINGIAVIRVIYCGPGFVMSDDLMAEEVKVDPVFRAAALRQTENRAVKMACSLEIVDGEGKVKRVQGGHDSMVTSRGDVPVVSSSGSVSGFGVKVPKEGASQLSWDGLAPCPADVMGVERCRAVCTTLKRGNGERVTEIILADNQAVFRAGAARVLAHENDLKVVGECTDVDRLREIVAVFARPIAIFPSSITPDMEELLRWIRTQNGRSVIILEHGITLPERLARQANGFLTRSVTGPQLLDTLRRVAVGQHVPQRSGIKEMPSPDHAGTQVVQRLTPKELQIVALVSEGAKNREIGVRLGTKEQVVKNYLRSIYDKVGVSDRLELALYTVHHRTLAEAVERVRATLAKSA